MRAPIYILPSLLLAGCIEPPVAAPQAQVMCKDDTDCATGETCGDNICWGNPPAQPYAAVLIPPTDRSDLIRTELPALEIASDGTLDGLSFATPVILQGRVVLACKDDAADAPCDPERSIPAHIHVTRPSRIPGAPPFVTTVTSQAGAETGASSFTLRLPPGQPGETYEVTVVPLLLDQTNASQGSASLAPPKRFTIEAVRDRSDLLWALGEPANLRTVRGKVVSAVGAPVAGMQVFAIGSGIPMELAARNSSINITGEDGAFTLRIPQSALDSDTIDLVIQPQTKGAAPTLRVRELLVPDPALLDGDGDVVDVGGFQMPSYGELQPFTVPVVGIDGGGDRIPIAQAEVAITTYVDTVDPRVRATFSTQAYTGDDGKVTLALIPGSEVENRRYVARVIPPARSEHASLHNREIDVGANQGGVLEAIQLERRTAVSGTIMAASGAPAAGTTVTASLALAFRWNLEPAARSNVDILQQPQVVADTSGRFLIWLDGHLLETAMRYDLELRPMDPLLPQWRWTDVVPAVQATQGRNLDLGVIDLPDAAYARGTVLGPDGTPIPDAKVGLYALAQDQSLCNTAEWPTGDEQSCVVPSGYLGPFPTDANGTVTVVMPDP